MSSLFNNGHVPASSDIDFPADAELPFLDDVNVVFGDISFFVDKLLPTILFAIKVVSDISNIKFTNILKNSNTFHKCDPFQIDILVPFISSGLEFGDIDHN